MLKLDLTIHADRAANGAARYCYLADDGSQSPTLRLHPGLAVAGLFDEVIEGWIGVPQSYECTEKLSFDPGAADRSWILTAFAHPGGFAALAPGFGPGGSHDHDPVPVIEQEAQKA